jgi:hypothetical protein
MPWHDSSMDVGAVRPVLRNRARTSGRPYRVHVRLTSEEHILLGLIREGRGLAATVLLHDSSADLPRRRR